MKKRSAVFLLALLPLAALMFQIVRWHVDVPFWDSWSLTPLLEKSYQGTLSLRDLLAQYNDSRPLVSHHNSKSISWF